MNGTEVHLYTDFVTLCITTTDKLKKKGDTFGYIEVSSGVKDSPVCFWDNFSFFISADYETFRKECREELRKKGFKTKRIYKDIKLLLKNAFKLKLLNK